jgi:hypothetical protein
MKNKNKKQVSFSEKLEHIFILEDLKSIDQTSPNSTNNSSYTEDDIIAFTLKASSTSFKEVVDPYHNNHEVSPMVGTVYVQPQGCCSIS